MEPLDDIALLREYATRNSEQAFAQLASRRVAFVYSAALRQVHDPADAEEITQAVFLILAQVAGRISDQTNLTGWLFKTTRFTALAHRRTATERRRREQEAHMQSELQSAPPDPAWEQMSPLLDEAIARLGEKDRQALLLRYFEKRRLSEVGSALRTGEDGARKRISRALEKLPRFFSKRGVLVTTTAISGAMAAHSVLAAPAELAISVGTTADQGSAVAASTLTLAKGAMKLMTWAKIKTAVWMGGAAILATTATTVAVNQVVAKTGGPSADSFATPPVLAANPPAAADNPTVADAKPMVMAANSPGLAANRPAVAATPAVVAADPPGIDDSVWERRVDLMTLPPVVIVRPTHFAAPTGPEPAGSGGFSFSSSSSSASASGGNLRSSAVTTASYDVWSGSSINQRLIAIAKAYPLARLMQQAYAVDYNSGLRYPLSNEKLMVLPPDAAGSRYDVLINVPNGSVALLAQAVEDQVGYVAHYEEVETDVLLLTVRQPGAPGLKPGWNGAGNAPAVGNAFANRGGGGGGGVVSGPSLEIDGHGGGGGGGSGGFSVFSIDNRRPGYHNIVFTNQPISHLVTDLDVYRFVADPAAAAKSGGTYTDANPTLFGPLVVDRTGLTGTFTVFLEWAQCADPDAEVQAIQTVLLNQLGLQLVPAREKVRMLVVQKVK